MAEGKAAVASRRADRVEVTAEAEDLRPLVRAEGVVDYDTQLSVADQLQQRREDQPAKRVGRPGPSREEAVVGLVVPPPSHAGVHQRLRDGVRAFGQYPAREDDRQPRERGPGQLWL